MPPNMFPSYAATIPFHFGKKKISPVHTHTHTHKQTIIYQVLLLCHLIIHLKPLIACLAVSAMTQIIQHTHTAELNG